MLFKTLIFLTALYFISRFISRLLMPQQARKSSTFTYRTNFNQRPNPTGRTKNLDSIEEAEFEEIKEKQSKENQK